MLGNCFASAGMDNTVKIWALDTAEVQEAVRQSYLWTPESRVAFHTCFVQFPAFSTAKVHNDYVDSVRWVGNLILSKSTENKVRLRDTNAPSALLCFACDHAACGVNPSCISSSRDFRSSSGCPVVPGREARQGCGYDCERVLDGGCAHLVFAHERGHEA